MKKIIYTFLLFPLVVFGQDLSLQGILDFTLPTPGSNGKAIHLVANTDISDLSVYGIGIANGGNGSDGREEDLPSISVSEGDDILLARIPDSMSTYFGDCYLEFEHIIESSTSINHSGDDAVELYEYLDIIEIFGDVDVDGSGEAWEYTDSWAYKVQGVWTYGGVNCTDGSISILDVSCPYPLCNIEFYGCTDIDAINYIPYANLDDGSCVYSLSYGLSLQGIIDFTLPSGSSNGRAIHLVANTDISDLSVYGIGIANNGGGTDGQEYVFDTISVSAGDDILLARTPDSMSSYLGDCYLEFEYVIQSIASTDYTGDDAIELYEYLQVIETFGDVDIDGSGEPWEYTDSWAYKVQDIWTYGGVNCTDATATMLDAICPYPECNYDFFGCTDETALNYNPNANQDDGTCIPLIYGCTTIWSENYDPTATLDDGSCIYCEYYFPEAVNYNAPSEIYAPFFSANLNAPLNLYYDCNGNCVNDSDLDGVCDEIELFGCTDINYFEYNALQPASEDDGSCLTLIIPGCQDESACNFNANTTLVNNELCIYPSEYNCEDATCINDSDFDGICDEFEYSGCTDSEACNYDELADVDNASCIYSESSIVNCDGTCINDTDYDGICDEFELIGEINNYNSCGGRYLNQLFSDVEVISDITYSEKHNLKLDIYQGLGDTIINQRPLIIYAYGGAWLQGEKEQSEAVAFSHYFAKRGYVVASIDYRRIDTEIFAHLLGCGDYATFLGIPVGWNECYDSDYVNQIFMDAVIKSFSDAKASVRFFRKSVDEGNVYRIDNNQIFSAGWSAGGQLGSSNLFLSEEDLNTISDTLFLNAINNNGGINGDSGNEGYSHEINGAIAISTGLYAGLNTWLSQDDSQKLYIHVHGTEDNVIPAQCNSFSIWDIIGDGLSASLSGAEANVVADLLSSENTFCGGYAIQEYANQNEFPNFHFMDIENGGHYYNEQTPPYINTLGENGENHVYDWISATLFPYLEVTQNCNLGCTDSTYLEYNPIANLDGYFTPSENSTYNVAAPIIEDFSGGCITPIIYGCTDEESINYNNTATVNDGSCIPIIYGCIDTLAFNYDSLANIDDGSCVPITQGCTDSLAFNYNPEANTDDGSCIPVILGCIDSLSCNYNPIANIEDNTCIYPTEDYLDCEDNCINDADEDLVCDEIEVLGCIDETACNYNSEATDQGDCFYPEVYYDCEGNCINDIDNDEECDEVDYDDGIGIDEISADIPALIKMIDVLGREQQEHKKGSLLFYIYDNGNVEKKFNP